jgi:hypothetical protein
MTKPQFPPAKIVDFAEASQWLQDASLSLCEPNDLDFEMFGVNKTLSNIMRELRQISHGVSTTRTHAAAAGSSSVPSLVCSILQRLLLLPPAVEPGPSVAYISECCRLATSLLLFLPWRNNYPNPKFMINGLLYKLKASLECMTLTVGTENPLLVWLLSVGGVLAFEVPERDWFVNQLVLVVTDHDIGSWNDMKGLLLKFLWFDSYCEGPFRLLWDEVVFKRDKLDRDRMIL